MSALPPPPPSGPSGPSGPSYGGYGSPYAGPYGNVARRPVQSLDGLALVTSILLGVMILLALFGVGAFFNRASVVDDVANGDVSFGQIQDVQDADDMAAGAVLVYLLGVLATAGVFIAWQYRHSRNAETIGGSSGLGPAWAIAGWFIPLANYVLPGVELFQSSQPSDPALHPQQPRRQGQGSPLVVVWAIAFGAGNILFAISRIMFPDEDDQFIDTSWTDDAITADNLAAGSFVILVAAAIIAIVMVRSLSRRQATAAAALVASGAPGYGAPGYGQPYPGPPGSAYPGPPGSAAPGYGQPGGYGQPAPGPAYPGSTPPGPDSGWPPPPGAP
jgi:hypothetical protein